MTTYHRTGAEALQDLKTRLEVGILGFLAYRAGRNHYNVHGDLEEAVIYGAHALRRWWVWIFFVKVWIFSMLFLCWMLWLRFHDIRGESFQPNGKAFNNVTYTLLVFMGPALLALGVTYCRNVDYSLFKRRFAYKVLRPVTIVLDKVPAWGLYLIVPCMLMFPTGWFRSDSPDSWWTPASIAEQTRGVCAKAHAARDRGDATVNFDGINLDVLHIDGDFEGWYREHC